MWTILKTVVLCFGIIITAQASDLDDKDRGVFSLTYNSPNESTETTSQAIPLACNAQITPIKDSRQNKETIGARFAHPLRAQGVDSWLETIKLAAIDEKISPDKAAETNLTVTPELTRLYTYAKGMSIYGTANMKVTFEVNGEILKTENIRGYNIRTNWNNGVGEYMSSVNKAMIDATEKLTDDLATICNTDE